VFEKDENGVKKSGDVVKWMATTSTESTFVVCEEPIAC
jgi:hypothetical protein